MNIRHLHVQKGSLLFSKVLPNASLSSFWRTKDADESTITVLKLQVLMQ